MKKIGWIGTGVMGFNMCRHLLMMGHTVNIFNRTKSKADPLFEEFPKTAAWMEPVDIAKHSDYLFLMLGYPQDVD